jgi:hypothetical protein
MVRSSYRTPCAAGPVGMVAGVGGPVDHDQVLLGHVVDEHADDAQGKMELGCRMAGGSAAGLPLMWCARP